MEEPTAERLVLLPTKTQSLIYKEHRYNIVKLFKAHQEKGGDFLALIFQCGCYGFNVSSSTWSVNCLRS